MGAETKGVGVGEVTAATVGCLNQEERTEKSSAAHV